MLEGAYDRDGIRILAEALNGALLELETTALRRLGEIEKADFVKRATCRLLAAFDMGERSPDKLKRVATSTIEQADRPRIIAR